MIRRPVCERRWRAGYRHVTELVPPPQRDRCADRRAARFSHAWRALRRMSGAVSPGRCRSRAGRLTGVYMPSAEEGAILAGAGCSVRRASWTRRAGDRRFQHLPRVSSMNRVRSTRRRISWTCGGDRLSRSVAASLSRRSRILMVPAIAATAFASTTRSCRRSLPSARGRCGIRTTNAWRACRIIRGVAGFAGAIAPTHPFPLLALPPTASRKGRGSSFQRYHPAPTFAGLGREVDQGQGQGRDRATSHHKEASRHEIRPPLLQHRPLR